MLEKLGQLAFFTEISHTKGFSLFRSIDAGKVLAGFSLKEVMTFAGHASVQMTMERYGHLFPSPDHQKAMALVEQRFFG